MNKKKLRRRKQHKYLGLIFTFFILAFSLSGIVLNHRAQFANVNINRKWLPKAYQIKKWNNGVLKGSISYEDAKKEKKVLIYGGGGMWLTDAHAQKLVDFNEGLPKGCDLRGIKEVLQLPDKRLLALNHWCLYIRDHNKWEKVDIPTDERLTSMAIKGDTLVVADRSHLYVSTLPSLKMTRKDVKTPEGYDGKMSLFRMFWTLHNGELFGTVGRLFVDAMAIVLIILSITGLIYWWLPKRFRRLSRKKKRPSKQALNTLTHSLSWHNKLGKYAYVGLLFITITGWFLRPPLLIPIASQKVSPLPFSTFDTPNAWHDQIRLIRYDDVKQDWLLHTTKGFYTLSDLDAEPLPIIGAPPVSVMGLTVMQRDHKGNWLAGSFSGMYIWNRSKGTCYDFFTHKAPSTGHHGPPVGLHGVIGYSADLGNGNVVVDFGGSRFAPMPSILEKVPMSLWNVALEVHVGRIFTFLGSMSIFYIFVMGAAFLWLLWTGWKVRISKRPQAKRKSTPRHKETKH